MTKWSKSAFSDVWFARTHRQYSKARRYAVYGYPDGKRYQARCEGKKIGPEFKTLRAAQSFAEKHALNSVSA